MNDELTCRELVEIITDYLEGSLSQTDRSRFEEHISVCPGCRRYLDQMRTTIRAMGSLSEDTIDPNARRELLDAFRSWRRS